MTDRAETADHSVTAEVARSTQATDYATLSPAADGRPSYLPTVVVSFLFGVFGAIPAARHARMATDRGFRAGRYWLTWILSWAAGVVVISVAVVAAVVPSEQMWPHTKLILWSALLIAALTAAVICDDLRADRDRATRPHR